MIFDGAVAGGASDVRAILAAAGTLIGRPEIALSRFTERQLRIAAFARPTCCARCYRYEPRPDGLIRQKPREPQLLPEWWCQRCVDRDRAERAARAADARLLSDEDAAWSEHREACPVCRRAGANRALARRLCPSGGAA